MESQVNVSVALYVATKNFPYKLQYEASQEASGLLEEHGLGEKVSVVEIDNLDTWKGIIRRRELHVINTSEKIRLPYLECHYGGGSDAPGLYGHSGLEEVTEELVRLGK